MKRLVGSGVKSMNLEVGGEEVILKSFGEGGLNFERILHNTKYVRVLQASKPDILILDLGTNDLCRRDPVTVLVQFLQFIDGLGGIGVTPAAIFALPVLPRTRAYAGAALSLSEYNLRVERFNRLLSVESFHRDILWVWEHRSLSDAPHHILDGVHLTERGMELYLRTLRRVISFCQTHFGV